MQFKHVTKLMKRLRLRLGDDLTYSIVLDQDKYYIAVSTERSDNKFYMSGDKKNTQFCEIQEHEFGDDINTLVDKVVPLFEDILFKRDKDDVRLDTIITV
jgi:hypothetical protein